MERWVGIVVSGDRVTIVDAEVDGANPLVLQSDLTWILQSGNRSEAYAVMSQQIADYVRDQKIQRVVVKESAVSRAAATMALLQSAELRGVVMASVGAIVTVETKAKGAISKTFGDRNVDEYVKDDAFWKKEVSGVALRAGSREAVLVLLAARNIK